MNATPPPVAEAAPLTAAMRQRAVSALTILIGVNLLEPIAQMLQFVLPAELISHSPGLQSIAYYAYTFGFALLTASALLRVRVAAPKSTFALLFLGVVTLSIALLSVGRYACATLHTFYGLFWLFLALTMFTNFIWQVFVSLEAGILAELLACSGRRMGWWIYLIIGLATLLGCFVHLTAMLPWISELRLPFATREFIHQQYFVISTLTLAVSALQHLSLAWIAYRARKGLIGMLLPVEPVGVSAYRGPTELR
jgi:hypothetical protein